MSCNISLHLTISHLQLLFCCSSGSVGSEVVRGVAPWFRVLFRIHWFDFFPRNSVPSCVFAGLLTKQQVAAGSVASHWVQILGCARVARCSLIIVTLVRRRTDACWFCFVLYCLMSLSYLQNVMCVSFRKCETAQLEDRSVQLCCGGMQMLSATLAALCHMLYDGGGEGICQPFLTANNIEM